MEAAEGRISLTLLEVVGPAVDALIQVGKHLGHGLDALVELVGGRVERLRFLQVAGLDGGNQLFGGILQLAGLRHHVEAVFGQRPQEVHGRGTGRFRLGVGRGRDVQLAARVAEQAAGDVVVAGAQLDAHGLGEARRDVLALLHHHDAVQDLPFQRPVGIVDDAEGGAASRHGDLVGLADLALNGDRDHIALFLRGLLLGLLRGIPEGAQAGDDEDGRAAQGGAHQCGGFLFGIRHRSSTRGFL